VLRIDDREPGMTEGEVRLDERARIIRTAMMEAGAIGDLSH
jgi:hypothetical protein